jgi:hypothetical protein
MGHWRGRDRSSVSIDAFSGASASLRVTAAAAYLATVGGGKIIVPQGTHTWSETVNINSSNIFIEGAGADGSHDVGTQGAQAGTTLNWTGAAGGTMLSYSSVSGASNQKMRGGGVRGCLFRANGGGVGLDIQSLASGLFEDLGFNEFTVSGINIGCVATLGEAKDTQENRFSRITGRQITQTGAVITLDGGSDSNASMNYFENVFGVHKDGNAFVFNNCDNNIFMRLRAFRAVDGTGYPVVFSGSDTALGQVARSNVFIAYSANAAGIAKGTSTYTHASHDNIFLASDADNATPIPTIEAGATLWWTDTKNAVTQFGTHTGTADVAITGYITIKDNGGTSRKLAVIA